MADADFKPELLPTDVVPKHYDLTITPDLKEFVFKGTVRIDLDVVNSVDIIELHGLDVVINKAEAKLPDGSTVGTGAFPLISLSGAATGPTKVHKCEGVVSKTEDTISIKFATGLPVGKASLTLDYDGELNNKMCGFYRAKAMLDGKEEWMAVTQHEPTDCRRTMPCFDEPALKATFAVTLIVPSDYTALSNMPVKEEKAMDGDMKSVSFDTTPPMSTYLLAMVVARLGFVEGKSAKGVKYRVYTMPGVIKQGEFALEVGMKVLDFFSEYFNNAYPLPKMDMVAIPDFSAGAMENWGLVTYRETALLIDEENSPLVSKQRVAYVVAHELAHQWFGNLVTMTWWTDLWLNEGFATWVGNFAIDHFYKDWDIWTQFVNQYTNRALQLDSLETSHPIEVPVQKSSQVNEIFDEISYCKGAACIMMITSYLGMEMFRKGICAYLEKHKYGNAVTGDLWAALTEASGKDVKTFMTVWTKEVGYPVVSLARADGKLQMEQARFLSNGKQLPQSNQWWVPMSLLDSEGKTVLCDVKDKTGDVAGTPAMAASWVKGNAGQTAFFRIRYSDELLAQLGEAIESMKLLPVDRLGVQSDSFALAKAGQLPTDRALALAVKYANEQDFTVWSDLAGSLGDVMGTWAKEDTEYEQLQKLLLRVMGKAYEVVGWEPKAGEHALTPMLRPLVIGALGRNGHDAVKTEAMDRMLKGGWQSVPADLRFAVFSIVVAHGGVEGFEAVLKVFKEADMAEERVRALRGLGYAKDPALIDRLLGMTLDDSIRSQDVFYVFGTLAGNRFGMDRGWDFIKANWEAIFKMFSSGQFLLGRILKSAASAFASEAKAVEVETFFKDKDTTGAERSISQALETIRLNAQWLERDRAAVKTWLAANT
mmetsp:Transcript_13033/g.26052  ORF Transcript_13033/g.26052 Transcript_13033/m.26052 type:complete len:879 (-) Transcript_13033:288-2924(-)|eukprot:CAMPEP_0181297958 /NCGR_PEP_ID=MMETSP1101-20121128/5524_1 /TAXON_ID=46948 /ORGANISM="Rhodomonas abbreviata, Strain Caron Lab Isolate" /LENGTH=878 /DNA_ID=CAMNT_0023402943 /DNA_START=370 /DNA_END=3006 /DNA_ORIENTATION=-